MNDHVTGSAEESSLQSFFGRLNYNYGGRYLLEMNVRHDGSSRMPKANRYATFPSFSGAWIMTNEKFMAVSYTHLLCRIVHLIAFVLRDSKYGSHNV